MYYLTFVDTCRSADTFRLLDTYYNVLLRPRGVEIHLITSTGVHCCFYSISHLLA